MGHPDRKADSIRVRAISRRGRPLEVLVTVTDLGDNGNGASGAILSMDVIVPAG